MVSVFNPFLQQENWNIWHSLERGKTGYQIFGNYSTEKVGQILGPGNIQ